MEPSKSSAIAGRTGTDRPVATDGSPGTADLARIAPPAATAAPKLLEQGQKDFRARGGGPAAGGEVAGEAEIYHPAALKFFKTGGTMVLCIWMYAMVWGWKFAVGFVVLLFVHECGHLVAARRVGLKVGSPVFIPFMGAFIALKEAPPNAWIECRSELVGRGRAAGAAVCHAVYLSTGNLLFGGWPTPATS